MIGSVDFVNLTGGYTLISVIQAFCSTVMSAVGGVVLDIDPRPATTYNNYRVTQKYIDIADNPTLACSCILHCISNCCFSSCSAWYMVGISQFNMHNTSVVHLTFVGISLAIHLIVLHTLVKIRNSSGS